MSGVVGVFSNSNEHVSPYVYYGLYAIQHRGQISSGIAVNNNGFVDYVKELGLVNEVFNNETIDRLRGNIAIGHVRYAAHFEAKNKANAQPLVVGYKRGALGISLDGSIVNFMKVREEMEDSGAIFQTDLDTEVIAALIAKYHKNDFNQAIVDALKDVQGSYAMVAMTNDRIVAARDPHGLKPLSIGKIGSDYIVASETVAFDTIGAELVRDVEPGEIVMIDKDGLTTIQRSPEKRSMCIFELVYLARPDSIIDDKSVYISRSEAGKQLYREFPTEADIVIGAPDSGIVAAIGYAEGSGIPYTEGIIKNRYVGRTFIEPTQAIREQGVRIKLNALRENIKGKSLVLVDDSIVRGTTIKRTVAMLRDAGAREIHVRIASPPVTHSCYLGVDTPSEENLIASHMDTEQIRQEIGAESLYFISLEGLVKAAGEENGFCRGCFSGNYPVERVE
ncbi:amidophosphoribosyltransferase [Gudongella sp. DL1XJH-153]|uniref:amidophosphoribosyltransferase n=1 Tax=Gudongella sp. DL1XJH-153 TaxID=3409804 RepID=UPI003BB4B88B